jgi:hypothetical protein
MLKSVARIFLIIVGIDLLAFVVGIFNPMNDTKPTFADTLDWVARNILFLPVSLFERQCPFFADGDFRILIGILAIIINDVIWAVAIWGIITILKRLWK